MLVLAPSTSLTLPSGRAKPLVRGEGDGNPAACFPGVRSPGPCGGVFPSYLAAVAAFCEGVSETTVDIVVTTPNAVLCCCRVEEGGENRISVGELDFNP